jgi:hypothetical protein
MTLKFIKKILGIADDGKIIEKKQFGNWIKQKNEM